MTSFPPDTATFLLQFVALVIVGIIGALTKKAFSDVIDGMRELSNKIDTVQATIAHQDKATALLEQRLDRLEDEVQRMREAS